MNQLENLCNEYGVTINEIKEKKKTAKIVTIRQIICYELRKTNLSLPKIGKLINRSHATVFHSIHKINTFIEIQDNFTMNLLNSISKHAL